ncbi:hypothetical protein V8C40DRAFT_194317 [Trichoderma camerunense]
MHDLDCVFCLFSFWPFFVIVSLGFVCLFFLLLQAEEFRLIFFFLLVSVAVSFSRVRTHNCKRPQNRSQVRRLREPKRTDVIASLLNRRATSTQDSKLVPRTCTRTRAFGAWHRAIRRIISRYRG